MPDGKLANAFICTANIEAADGGARIVDGNRKVLAARLSDAKFFYETDLKVPLDAQATKLDRIIFHEKLGTVADKVARVAKLARWLVEEGIVGSALRTPTPFVPSEVEGPVADAARGVSTALDTNGSEVSLADLTERAAKLCKADLVTGMVGEFPELQGVMGGYYALAQGEDPRVAAAIRDHYKPVGQGDEVPTDPVTVAVSLADKLDTLAGFFMIGEQPSGSRDPFALRRATLGIISLAIRNGVQLRIADVFLQAGFWSGLQFVQNAHEILRRRMLHRRIAGDEELSADELEVFRELGRKPFEVVRAGLIANGRPFIDFFADRLKVQQREAGVRHDLIDAVFALGGRG